MCPDSAFPIILPHYIDYKVDGVVVICDGVVVVCDGVVVVRM